MAGRGTRRAEWLTSPSVSRLGHPVHPKESMAPRAHLRIVEAADAGPSDAVLVARASSGDRAAFEAIYRRHAAHVLPLATRLLRDALEAEDVTQETFELVLAHLRRLRDPAALRPWIVQIAVRQVRQRFRKRRLLRTLGLWWTQGDGAPVPLEECASSEASAEHRAELALLDHALRQLPDEDRLAWMLRHVEGLALEEVATAAGCSLATVKRRIYRAHTHVSARVALEEGA